MLLCYWLILRRQKDNITDIKYVLIANSGWIFMPQHRSGRLIMQVRNSAYAILEIHALVATMRTMLWSNLARACLCPKRLAPLHWHFAISGPRINGSHQKVNDTLREQKHYLQFSFDNILGFLGLYYSHGFWYGWHWFGLYSDGFHYNNRRAAVCKSLWLSIYCECAQCADKYERLFWLGTESMCYLQNRLPHKWALEWCSAEILSHSSPWSFSTHLLDAECAP